ncbi:MAG: hypothetical protein AAF685_07635 [Cyanobacteria bacterium P01_C01_bin.89]
MPRKFELPSVDADVASTFSEVWDSGKVTNRNRQEIKSALLCGGLTHDDHMAIDRMVHAVKRGWLSLD